MISPCSFLAVRMMQPVASATRHSAMVAGFVFGRDGRCSTSFWLRTCNDRCVCQNCSIRCRVSEENDPINVL